MSDEPAGPTETFHPRWSDLDPNGHLRHSVYADFATHARFRFLEENGFGADRFRAEALGPVIFREETRFYKEVRMGQAITVDFRAAGMSEDGSQWRITHRIFRGRVLAAEVTLEGGWMDLRRRKLRPPPEELHQTLMTLPKVEGFEVMKGVVGAGAEGRKG